MTTGSLAPLLHHLRRLVEPAADAGPGDAELLHRFADHGDGDAFAALLRRHEALVRGVCRRVLRDRHAAEDAFQATFLVLARKARSLARPDRLGPWLYGVALRTARRARVEAARRRAHESRARPRPATAADDGLDREDVRAVLDDAVNLLPEKYRAPVVLCYLQGRTNAEAAARLGCSRGTVATWLARARRLLRASLTRRGLSLPAGGLAAALTSPAPAAVPAALVRAAVLAASGQPLLGAVPPTAAALMKGVEWAMWTAKVKGVVLVLALGLAVGAGASLYPARGGDRPPGVKREPPQVMPPADEAAKAKPPAAPRVMPRVEDVEEPTRPTAPSAKALLAYLNENTRRVPVLECEKVSMDVKVGKQSIGLEGRFVIRKPHDVRVKFDLLGQPAIDLGGNDQGWWFWCSRAEPAVPFQARRKDVSRGTAASWPFPDGPDALVWIMGMKEYDPAAAVEVVRQQDTIELVEKAVSPQGKPIRRVTVFQRPEVRPPRPQVKGYRIEDAEGKVKLRVEIREVQIDRASGASVPIRLQLYWPVEQVEVSVRLYEPTVGAPLKQGRAIQLFTPPAVIPEAREKP